MSISKGRRRGALPFFPEGAWGCLVSKREDVRAAVDLGASWLVATHAGLLPRVGPASVIALMPYADANGLVLEMGPQLMEEARGVPVFAGVLAMDQFREYEHFLGILAETGFAGIQTFPSVGILDGGFRHLLDDANLGREVELNALGAAARLGLHACGLSFAPGEAGEAVAAGADMVLAHLPLSPDGELGEWTAANRKLFAAAGEEAGEGTVVAAFVPDGGKPFKRGLLGEGARLQFESVAGAARFLG